MTQEHQVPTQIQIDSYIAEAKALRCEALASLSARFFQLPARTMEFLASAINMKKPAGLAAMKKNA